MPNLTEAPARTPDGPKVSASVVAGAVVFLVTLAVFLPALRCDFVAFDDPTYVIYPARDGRLALTWANVAHWFRTPVVGIYVPLAMLSYMLDFTIWGIRPWGYHLTSVLCHALSGVVLYALLQRLRFSVRAAAAVALLFLVHPMRVESVVWVSERKDVLCLLFAIATAYVYIRLYPTSRRPGAWAFPLFAMAMLSKPAALPLPFVLLLYCRWRERKLLRTRVVDLLPMLALSATFVPVTYLTQSASDFVASSTPITASLAVTWYNVLRYTSKLFLPVGLTPLYARQQVSLLLVAKAAAGTVVCAGMYALCHWRRRRLAERVVVPLVLAYLFMLAPVSGIVPLGMVDFADRYSYFCHVPLVILVSAVLLRLRALASRRVATAVVVVCLAVCVSVTRATIRIWESTDALWGHVIGTGAAGRPVHPAAFSHYAKYKLTVGAAPDDALVIVQRGIQAGALTFDTLFVRARCLQRVGRAQEAAVFYETCSPRPLARRKLEQFLEEGVECFLSLRRSDRARQLAIERVQARRDARALLLLGKVAYTSGDTTVADAHFAEAVRLSRNRDAMERRIALWLRDAAPRQMAEPTTGRQADTTTEQSAGGQNLSPH